MHWSRENDTYLRENYGHLKATEIAKNLKMNVASIYQRAKRLGLLNKNKTCVVCGKPFVAYISVQKTCRSAECRRKWKAIRYKIRKERDPKRFREVARRAYKKWKMSEKGRLSHIRRRERMKMKRLMLKIEVVKLLGAKCQKCGYTGLAALQIHHTDPNAKRSAKSDWGEIWRNKQVSQASELLEEIKDLYSKKKIMLLCANCHAEEHWGHQNHVPESILQVSDKTSENSD